MQADQMRPHLMRDRHLVVIGGGYIGLEVAAVADQFGMKVTVIEVAERILQRVASPQTSDFFRELHSENGVNILESAGLKQILDSGGMLGGIEMNDGSSMDADMVLIGIGVLPQTELAEACGLHVDNGIVVDAYCATSDSDIFAAGDCTSFHYRDALIRLESVPNAIHQAEVAAHNMRGEKLVYEVTPWFWSDQYDVKLQIAGLNTGFDSTVIRPGKREGSQSIWYYRGDQLLAVDAMNDAPSFMMARRILEAGKSLPKNKIGTRMEHSQNKHSRSSTRTSINAHTHTHTRAQSRQRNMHCFSTNLHERSLVHTHTYTTAMCNVASVLRVLGMFHVCFNYIVGQRFAHELNLVSQK